MEKMAESKKARGCAFLLAPLALPTVLGSSVAAAPVDKYCQVKNKEKNISPAPLIANPSHVIGTCSYQAGSTPHTLTLLRADLPLLSLEEDRALLRGVPPQEFDRYRGNIAYLVIDTAQSAVPHPKVVWGTYGVDGNRVRPSPENLMGDVVWDARTHAAYAVLGKTDGGHSVSIYVYKIDLASDLAPLPLKLEAASRLSALSDARPLVETTCATGLTEVKSVQASATAEGLRLHFLRDYPDENRAEEYKAPLDVFLNLTTYKWSGTYDRNFGVGRIDKL